MSFTVYQLPDRTLLTAIPFLPAEYGKLLDALLSIHMGVSDSSKRLYEQLLTMSESKGELPYEVKNEVWTLLDGIDRAFTIARRMNLTVHSEKQTSIELLSRARNSFHHLDDRITHFFAKSQGSIFGDLYWRYRPSLAVEELGLLYITSPSSTGYVSGPSGVTLNLPNPDVENETGIYDLRLYYVEGNPKNTLHKPIELSVDHAVQMLNSLMRHLQNMHKEGLERFKETQPDKQLPRVQMPECVIVFFGGGNNKPKEVED